MLTATIDTRNTPSQQAANFKAWLHFLSALPPVRQAEMVRLMERTLALPRCLRVPYMRLWGFVHPIPYILHDDHAPEERAPKDAFMDVYGAMSENERAGLVEWMNEFLAEQAAGGDK